jgi:hypothetical protein
MTNDLENQSPEKSEDFLPYAFTEDAVSEEDALESVGQEDLPSGVVLVAPRTGMSALSLGEAVVETILANANWKIPLAITPNNHRLGV